MTTETLFVKWWYRALKVVFFFALIISLFTSSIIIYSVSNEKEITSETYVLVGDKVKQYYPEYNTINSEELGRKSLGKILSNDFYTASVITPQSENATKRIGEIEEKYLGEDIANKQVVEQETRGLLQKDVKGMKLYSVKYAKSTCLFMFLMTYFIVSIIFIIVAEIFYYVISGELLLTKGVAKFINRHKR
ncbi:hypothetical protein A2524_00450 [Candidatus Wolfebacteria bacterium RIFOXYD12_FULL_48_21]|uniref:Uncharacterized protein n=1 Tax=Candidatus Wolfebacteria bacterium RIFOXYD1_FULL_48_65 TaxID=1802561 RepID=A0A1F8E1G0_9BACT|nr:MAG: hypothetical protein A2610_01385 [Candidatus Wolfebacteria bacterium RIFOXYD1_FULL_48_65]OGM94909.1 MAG: hypothetical protein A2524_00450 [Candidatus Wolfebacteria bacterium RIFOXYD12_FULL_48_21]OGM96529.1 MAG: hypothetical protein A2532_02320 [Candidatus Wolfebacteria bacterium RIFOXYD2_FULL_48_11]